MVLKRQYKIVNICTKNIKMNLNISVEYLFLGIVSTITHQAVQFTEEQVICLLNNFFLITKYRVTFAR